MAEPASTVEPLAPATLTDMLDGGWQVLHDQPGTVLGLGAVFLVPAAVLSGLATSSIETQLQTSFGLLAVPSGGDGAFPLAGLLVMLLAAAVRALGVLYLGVALTLVALASRSGSRLGLAAAVRQALGRSPAVLGAWPLLSLGSLVAYAACVLPLAVWLTFTAVVAPVIATEGLGPVAAIGRSFSLVARRFWMALGVVLLSSLVAYVISTVLLLVPQAFAGALPWGARWAALSLVGTLAATLTVGPLVLSCTLLYLDLRVRTEGLDLRQRTAAAFPRAG